MQISAIFLKRNAKYINDDSNHYVSASPENTKNMTDMPLIGAVIALILAAIGAFFAYKCLVLWKRVDITGVGIEVTKDRAFLSNNFKLVLIIGGLSALHIFLELIERFYSPPTPFFWEVFYFVYYLDQVLLMLVLLVLAIVWYRLLSRVSRWDRRWVKVEKKQPS